MSTSNSSTSRPAGADPAHVWLELLTDRSRTPVEASQFAILVAHPDDETIVCGAQLQRLRNAQIIVLTDGAPRDLQDARRLGFHTAQEYAAARSMELIEALSLAGVTSQQITHYQVPDQEAALQLAPLARQVTAQLLARNIRCVLTLAYEGGHPDHDAAAFIAHVSADLLRQQGHEIGIAEAPVYRAGADTALAQQFTDDAMTPTDDLYEIYLEPEEQRLKQSMLAAYVSQRQTLQAFTVECERFRPAPRYNFTELPNGGRLLYERHPWGMTGDRWRTLTRAALDELGVKSTWH